MVSKIEDTGCIQCDTHHSNPKFYTATKKPFNYTSVKELYKVKSSRSQRSHGRCKIVQIQKATFKCKILNNKNLNIKWDKEYTLRNGVSGFVYSYPFRELNGAVVVFRRIVSLKGSDQLLIDIPRIDWMIENGKPYEYLLEVAQKCAVWFQKNFTVELSDLEISKLPENALVLNDPLLIELAQKGSYSVGNLKIDASEPHGIPEIESTDYDLIEGLASAPKRINVLEQRFSKMEGMFQKIMHQQEVMIGLLENNMTTSVKPDELREVA